MRDDEQTQATPTVQPAALETEPSVRVSIDGDRPAVIGRFQVLEQVGQGAMGKVFAAYDPTLDRRVAVKVLHGREDIEQTMRVHREAHAMARLSHPNVAQVYEVGDVDGQTYIAMEFIDGSTLEQWYTAEARPWRAVVDMFVQVGRGLAAAHAAGMIHRDFKPQNVLVGADGRPRIIDFGLARAGEDEPPPPGARNPAFDTSGELLRSPLTREGVVSGTPAYMSPEQVRGRVLTPASDQFAFCVALFEAVYGGPPFTRKGVMKRLHAISMGQIRTPPTSRTLPPEVHDAICRGLAADPEARWPSVEALVLALGADPEMDRAAGWRGRITALGMLLLIALASTITAVWAFSGESVRWGPLLAADAAAAAVLLSGLALLRRRLLRTVYHRQLAAWLVVVVIGPLVSRTLGAMHAVSIDAVVGFDLLMLCFVSFLVGVAVIRWAFATALVFGLGAFATVLWSNAIAVYGLTLAAAAGTALLGTWREGRADP